MYICINTAVADPVCVSGQTRREERRQIDSQKERAASRLSGGPGGFRVPEGGGWDSTPTQTELRDPAGEKCSPLVQLTRPSPPSHTHKHTTGTRINPREDHNRCTCPAPPPDSLGPFRSSVTHRPNRD